GDVAPVAYYNFNNRNFQFYGGEFPREGLVNNFPRALLNDTLRYFRPNIQGLLAKYTNNSGTFTETGFIDWLSRQTDVEREQFMFGDEGKYIPGGPNSSFYISHFFFLEHDAGAA